PRKLEITSRLSGTPQNSVGVCSPARRPYPPAAFAGTHSRFGPGAYESDLSGCEIKCLQPQVTTQDRHEQHTYQVVRDAQLGLGQGEIHVQPRENRTSDDAQEDAPGQRALERVERANAADDAPSQAQQDHR